MAKSIGLVGLPNSGKSSLFNFFVKNNKNPAKVSSVMFSTINPNIGKVSVFDERLEVLSKKSGSKTIIFSEIEIFDIAGLVEEASENKGKGNKFLSEISQVDIIVYVLRFFDKDQELVGHLLNNVSPLEDFYLLQKELLNYDLKHIPENTNQEQIDKLKKFQPVKIFNKKNQEISFLSQKPAIIILNGEYIDLSSLPYKVFYLNLDPINPETTNEKVFIKHCFDQLGYITYFTTGQKETRAWKIPANSNLIKAASVIHSDFARDNIKANKWSYNDFLQDKKPTIEKSSYIVQDGDILVFF